MQKCIVSLSVLQVIDYDTTKNYLNNSTTPDLWLLECDDVIDLLNKGELQAQWGTNKYVVPARVYQIESWFGISKQLWFFNRKPSKYGLNNDSFN